MQRANERDLRELLTQLKAEHRDLDTEIVTAETSGIGDPLQVKPAGSYQ